MIASGARVRLRGLVAKPELNGLEGACRERQADTGRWKVKLDDGTEFAFKEDNLEFIYLGLPGHHAGPAVAGTCGSGGGVVEGLDRLLTQLDTSRGAVLDAMAYCMEHAAQHAPSLARRLASSLGKRGLSTAAARARLFVVSDVLHNARRSQAAGAAALREGLQELLPGACEQLGCQWLQQLASPEEQALGEETVRSVLRLWREWGLFPPLFTAGLESLIFAPVLEISAKEAGNEPDERLRRKLTRWFSGLAQAQLPSECWMRGLAGRAPSASVCRARLCHYEGYWHLRPGAAVRLRNLRAAPHLNGRTGTCTRWDFAVGRWEVRLEDGAVKKVKQENLTLEGASGDDDWTAGLEGLSAMKGEASPAVHGTSKSRATNGHRRPIFEEDWAQLYGDDEDIDGEPLSEEDLRCLSAMDTAAGQAGSGFRDSFKDRLGGPSMP